MADLGLIIVPLGYAGAVMFATDIGNAPASIDARGLPSRTVPRALQRP
jgi:hypothetical protein